MATSEEAFEQIRQAIGQLDYVELQKVSRLVEKEQKRQEKEAKKQAQQEMKQVAQKYGLDLEEIIPAGGKSGSGAKGNSKGNKVPPKYRHPEDPEMTWTGRGRKPKWVAHWVDELGRDLEELRIPDSET
ncbi:MAG: H-NS family nucleoid-associated regulatory protein [Halorhodospira sp.]